MSWTASGSVSTTWALANVNDYVVVDYVVDFYFDDNVFSTVSAAANTWTDAS